MSKKQLVKLSTLLDKTLNKNVLKLVKVAVFFFSSEATL